MIYLNFIKPLGGWVVALTMFFVLAPFLFFLIVALLFWNKGNVFFTQVRIGKNKKPFLLIKFKSMLDLYDANGVLLPDLERQTRIGNFMRHYHLDELPQIINILNRDLNFIGPRPLLVEYVPYYNEVQQTRHNCKPGITGLVQVLGGNNLSWGQRLRLDVFYVEHQSFSLDCRIVWLTVQYFFKKKLESHTSGLFSSETFIEYTLRQSKKSEG